MVNTLDVTLSGYPVYDLRDPCGGLHFLSECSIHAAWKSTPSKTTTLNLVNIESFRELVYPVVEVKFTENKISLLKKLWYVMALPDYKVFTLSIKVIGEKKVTEVTMRSKERFLVDESAECLKNALDACIWTADSKFFSEV